MAMVVAIARDDLDAAGLRKVAARSKSSPIVR
jgi:hypothetical protein